MTRVLVFGPTGCLGREVVRRFEAARWLTLTAPHAEVDITRSVADLVKEIAPQVVVNCAAFTDVDACEDTSSPAISVNDAGAANIAEACALSGALMVHVSTDMVFGGKATPRNGWTVLDEPCPVNSYGMSKLAGEQAVRGILGSHAVTIRTSWLLGERGWLPWAITQARQDKWLEGVSVGWVGRPTLASDLAEGIFRLAAHHKSNGLDARYGLYHFANDGVVERGALYYAVACSVFGKPITPRPPSKAMISSRARRSMDCTLETTRFAKMEYPPPHWAWQFHPLVQKVNAQIINAQMEASLADH